MTDDDNDLFGGRNVSGGSDHMVQKRVTTRFVEHFRLP
jgi:hypothetical protein